MARTRMMETKNMKSRMGIFIYKSEMEEEEYE